MSLCVLLEDSCELHYAKIYQIPVIATTCSIIHAGKRRSKPVARSRESILLFYLFSTGDPGEPVLSCTGLILSGLILGTQPDNVDQIFV